jgi:hypothetical protein
MNKFNILFIHFCHFCGFGLDLLAEGEGTKDFNERTIGEDLFGEFESGD